MARNKTIKGKIIKMDRKDEISERLFATIKTPENINYYVPFFKSDKEIGENIEVEPLKKVQNQKQRNQKGRE